MEREKFCLTKSEVELRYIWKNSLTTTELYSFHCEIKGSESIRFQGWQRFAVGIHNTVFGVGHLHNSLLVLYLPRCSATSWIQILICSWIKQLSQEHWTW